MVALGRAIVAVAILVVDVVVVVVVAAAAAVAAVLVPVIAVLATASDPVKIVPFAAEELQLMPLLEYHIDVVNGLQLFAERLDRSYLKSESHLLNHEHYYHYFHS